MKKDGRRARGSRSLSAISPAGPPPARTAPRAAYNSAMIPDLPALFAPAIVERLVLLFNHVLSAEPPAMQRLMAHQGKVVRLEFAGWPRLLPALPMLSFRITPAGLIEWAADAASSELRVSVPADNPLGLAIGALGGARPPLDIEGDAQFAADIDWLARNLRWDAAGDLEQVFGPAVAHQLDRIGSLVAGGLRAAVERASALTGFLRAR
jgi:ubiquinone biosynthesis protein UbiJ